MRLSLSVGVFAIVSRCVCHRQSVRLSLSVGVSVIVIASRGVFAITGNPSHLFPVFVSRVSCVVCRVSCVGVCPCIFIVSCIERCIGSCTVSCI